MKRFYIVLALFCKSIASFSIAISSANGGGSWHSAASWSPAQVPSTADDVIITVGNPITNNAYAFAKSITINVGTTLTKVGTVEIWGNFALNGTLAGSGNMVFSSAAAKVISGGTWSTEGNVSFALGTTTINSTIYKGGNFYISDAAIVTNNASVTLVSGSITLGVGSVFTNAAGSSLSIYSNIVNGGGTFNASANANTVILSGGVTSVPVATGYHHLTLQTGTKSLAANTDVNGTLTINSSTNLVGTGFTITLGGDFTNNTGISNLTSVSITFDGTGTQTISKPGIETFRTLTFSGTGTTRLTNPIYAVHITMNSGTFDAMASGNAIYMYGIWTHNGGTYTHRNNTVFFQAAGAMAITVTAGTATFYNITKLAAGTLTLSGSIRVTNIWSMTAGTVNGGSATLLIDATWSHTGGTWTPSTSTVTFQGSSHTITSTDNPLNFYNVNKTGTATITLTKALTCLNNLSLTGGTLDVSASNYAVNVGGNLTVSATFNTRSNTVTLNGTASQDVTATVTTTFFNLTHSNAAGSEFVSGTFNITNILTSTSGILTNTGGTVTLVSTSSKVAIVGSGAGSFAGNYNLQRYIGARSANWHDFSSPVASTTLLDWDGSVSNEIFMSGVGGSDGNALGEGGAIFYSVQRYDEPSSSYVDITSTGYVLGVGEGLQIFLGDDLSNWNASRIPDTRGTPNSGAPVVALSTTSGRWNILGNPFHAFVDWSTVTRSNVDLTFYMLNNSGSYVSYGAGATVPPLQGFMCHATAGGAASLTFAQAAKTASTSTTFNRGGTSPFALKIKLSSELVPFWQENTLSFDPGTTLDFDDGLDGYYFKSPSEEAPGLYMDFSGTHLTRNVYNPVNSVEIIPLVVSAGKAGEYQLSFTGVYSLKEYESIELRDKLLNTTIDLKKDPYYSFELGKGEMAGRFELILRKSFAVTEDKTIRDNISVFNSEEGIQVNLRGYESNEVQVRIYNSMGQVIYNNNYPVSSQDQNIAIPLQGAKGIYFVEVNGNGMKETAKLFLDN